MYKKYPLFIFTSMLMIACTSNKVLTDLPSLSGKYHVEVRQCQQNGSFWGTVTFQVSILNKDEIDKCKSSINSLVQFHSFSPIGQLELEWISDEKLRAWHPSFKTHLNWISLGYRKNSPIKVEFIPNQNP